MAEQAWRPRPCGYAHRRSGSPWVPVRPYYEDGTQRSNRRVPASALGGLDGDEPAKAVIAEQDAEIAEKSGQPRGPIKSIRRAGEPEPRSLQKSERVAQR